MSNQLTLLSPAKLNLFLHILGRREDGYHELQTAFQLLDYGDEINITANQSGQIKLMTYLEGVPEESNIIYKAAELLKQEMRDDYQHCGADICFKKRIPMGGGLGGGSSNAATVLLALNQLWDCQCSLSQLAELGLTLGADVPVFIYGKNAWAEGVGEQLQDIELPKKYYLIIYPNVSVSTAEIFSDGGLTRDSEALTITRFLQGEGCNVFEPVVRKNYPLIDAVFQWAEEQSGNENSLHLTGSGSCMFMAFSWQKEAEKMLRELPENCLGFVAKGVGNSSVHQTLFS